MARLPIPGSDEGNWGDILNDFLQVAHTSDGTLKVISVSQGGTGSTDANSARLNIGAASSTDLASHIDATESVHGIANTAHLVLTSDARLADQRTPTDSSVTDIKIANNAAIAQSKIANLGADLAAKAPIANAKGYVNHGSNADTTRPSGYTSVEWYGSVAPANAIVGDTWIDTA